MDLKKYKENNKTSYLGDSLERLLKEEEELHALLKGDPSMKEMADEELRSIAVQKDELIKHMEDILSVEEKEEEFPNEVILEVRAGAGGEEAALFAEKLALMY